MAASAPTGLDGGASEVLRFAPGAAEALIRALQKALLEGESRTEASAQNGHGESTEDVGAPAGHAGLAEFLAEHPLERLAEIAEVDLADLRDAAALLTDAENVVVVWGERLGWGERGAGALGALADLALVLGLDAAEGSGLIELPADANGRGLREVGCLPGLDPGLADGAPGMTAEQARDAGAAGELKAFYLLHRDPLRELPGRAQWDEALRAASFVVAHEQFLSESAERYADVVFPGESDPEKEGTVTHPDGRLQRLRPAIGRPGEVRIEWQVLGELGARLGLVTGELVTAGAVLSEIAAAVPFYSGVTLDEIGGRGVRWQQREAAAASRRAVRAAALRPLRGAAPPADRKRQDAATRHPLAPVGIVDHRARTLARLPEDRPAGRAEPPRRRAPRHSHRETKSRSARTATR